MQVLVTTNWYQLCIYLSICQNHKHLKINISSLILGNFFQNHRESIASEVLESLICAPNLCLRHGVLNTSDDRPVWRPKKNAFNCSNWVSLNSNDRWIKGKWALSKWIALRWLRIAQKLDGSLSDLGPWLSTAGAGWSDLDDQQPHRYAQRARSLNPN